MIKVTFRCPYCETVCVMQGTAYREIACYCKAARAVRVQEIGGEVVHIGINTPESAGYIKVAPPVEIPAEEARARENVAGLVARIDALEQQLAGVQGQAGVHAVAIAELTTTAQAARARIDQGILNQIKALAAAQTDTALVQRVSDLEMELVTLAAQLASVERDLSGAALAQRIGAYMQTVGER